MARNAEKAQSMLFRFRASQAASLGIVPSGSSRPRNPRSVEELPLAERWRGQVLRDISRKVTKIQDQSLSHYQVRDLNDELNALMREKWAWERRIRDLGGPNYMRAGTSGVVDAQGREVPGGGKGYRYFGRARELPGVKELFEAAALKAKEEREGGSGQGDKNPMAAKGRVVDAGYYGWNRDEEEDNGALLAYEREKEAEAREALLRQEDQQDDKDWTPLPGDTSSRVNWDSGRDGSAQSDKTNFPWPLPTQADVENELIARRQRRLLDSLGS